jgi:hypothetical protein
MKFYEIERIKLLLGLPLSASISEIEARINELRDKDDKLAALKGQQKAGGKKQ